MDFHKAKSRMLRHVTMPSNLGTVADPSGRAIEVGSCGDSLEVTLRVKGTRITEIRCMPNGCGFTIACASAMSELARGRTLDRALEITPSNIEAELGGLPEERCHCARLAVNTLGEAVSDCYRRQRPAAPKSNSHPDEEVTPDAPI